MIKFFNIIEKNRARIVNWLIILFIINLSFDLKLWDQENKIFYSDVLYYYSYLPATFIHHDLALDFVKKDPAKYRNKFWPRPSPNGKLMAKMSMGVSFLYAPFFFIGHIAAHVYDYEPNGFSKPYRFALAMSAIFYLAIGLFYLRKILKIYFSEWITALTCLSVVIGTNLLHYTTTEPTMSHTYVFSATTIFIYFLIKWFENPTYKNTILLGLLTGLITLIRPTNIIILIFILLYKVYSWSSFKDRIISLIKKYKLILLMILAFLIVWIPQMLYWKYVTGHYIYYSYEGEGFFFDNPQIISGLFSYRKGWLLYTPIMVFALIGIPFLFRKQKEFFLPVLLYTILNIYIVLSWWSWWYGGGFGLRAFIDSYVILAIPLAAFLSWCFNQKIIFRILTIIVIFTFIWFNHFQTRQYYYGAIHWDSMTKAAYWNSFGRIHPTIEFRELLEQPDYEAAKQGK